MIFTDALQFKPWIDQVLEISQNLGNVDVENLIPKVATANLSCTFQIVGWSGFPRNKSKSLQTCYIADQKIDCEGFFIAGDPNPKKTVKCASTAQWLRCWPRSLVSPL